jgi:hypothetical protein
MPLRGLISGREPGPREPWQLFSQPARIFFSSLRLEDYIFVRIQAGI